MAVEAVQAPSGLKVTPAQPGVFSSLEEIVLQDRLHLTRDRNQNIEQEPYR